MQTFRRGTGFHGVWAQLVLCIALWSAACAGAQANNFVDYEVAYVEFLQLADVSLAEGQRMPQLADQNAARLLAVLSNTGRFLDAQTYATQELSALLGMCAQTSTLVKLYTFVNVDLRKPVGSDAEATDKAVKAVLLNLRTYSRELESLHTFQLDCMGKQVSLLGEHLASLKPEDMTPIRRAGAQESRNGAFGTYYGFLKAVNDAEVDEPHAAHIMAALARNAVQYASVMQPAQRQQLVGFMESGRIKASLVLRPHLEKIMAAMSSSECTGICAL